MNLCKNDALNDFCEFNGIGIVTVAVSLHIAKPETILWIFEVTHGGVKKLHLFQPVRNIVGRDNAENQRELLARVIFGDVIKWCGFVDADDTVEPELFPRAIDAMRRDEADYCRVAYDEISVTTGERRVFPLKRDYRFASNAEIVERFVPCFYGYSFANVRDWYRGTPLFSNREMGTVWSGAFRLDLIRANGIRFDETIEINEDAIFLCAYLMVCRRTTAVNEVLYHYTSAPTGSLRMKSASPRFFANKERMLAARRRLDSASGGRLAAHYQASCVFSLLEILAVAFRFKGCLGCGLAAFRRYGRDPAVRAALRAFPLSGRKPVLAVAVLFCRLFFPSRTGEQFLIK
jgi:hypothetical protein